MITRRKKIIFIQLTIFLFALSLLYNTYRDKNVLTEAVNKVTNGPNTNNFTDIMYSGFDLNGNRYTLNAAKANFKTAKPNLINMQDVVANFYLQDDTVLKIVSEKGLYDNKTLDMNFSQNVKAVYLANTLLSDVLNYSNSNGKLLAYGNVRGESVEKGEFSADNVEYSLTNKTLDFSMFGSKRVNVKIKN